MFAIQDSTAQPHWWKACALVVVAALSSADLAAQEAKVLYKPRDGAVLQRMPVLEAASNVKASAYPSHVYLRWTCPAGATGFDVFVTPAGGQQTRANSAPIPAQCVLDIPGTIRQPGRSIYPPGTSTPSTNTYSIGFTHSGLSANRQYSYVVRAIYSNGVAGAQPVLVTTPLWPAPTGVQLKVEHQPAPQSGSHVIVSWNAVQGAPGYEVWATSLYDATPDWLVTATPVVGTTFTHTQPIGVEGYFVKTVDGLASATVNVAW